MDNKNDNKNNELMVKDDNNIRDFLPEYSQLTKLMKKYVIGQDETLRRFLTNIYRAYDDDNAITPTIILLVGSTGSGKSYMVKKLVEFIKVAFTMENATDFTKAGYYGADVNDIFYNLTKSSNDIDMIEHGIIFIDEIDKLVGYRNDDVGGSSVYKAILAQLDGRDIVVKAPKKKKNANEWNINTSKMIFIFAGAFEGLQEIRKKRLENKKIGFKIPKNDDEDISNINERKYIKEDIIKFGIIPEFAGRINAIIELNTHTIETLTQILEYAQDSRLMQLENLLLNKYNISVVEYENFTKDIAKQALKLGTGARELITSVNLIFEEIFAQLYEDTEKYKNSYCVLQEGIVEDNKKFQWYKKTKQYLIKNTNQMEENKTI